jgi:hypothetical protein
MLRIGRAPAVPGPEGLVTVPVRFHDQLSDLVDLGNQPHILHQAGLGVDGFLNVLKDQFCMHSFYRIVT